MNYSQNNQAANPPWSTSAYSTSNSQQTAQQQQQQWQQYSQYSAQGTTNNQQYANYYQQPTTSGANDQYYQQYYSQQQQQSYGNPPPPGVEGPPGVSQGPPGVTPSSTTAAPGTSSYNYNYSQYPGYYSQNSYNQQNTYSAPPQPQYQQYQQQPYSGYNSPQKKARPASVRPFVHNPVQSSPTTYQSAPVLNKPQPTKIPPWSKKPVETKVEQPPPPPPVQQYRPPPPAPPVKSAEDKAQEKSAMAVETWPPSLKQYVQDVFANCLPNKRDQAEEQLRNLIIESHKAGTLITTDWSEMDLPSACNNVSKKKKKKGKKNQVQTKNNVPKPNMAPKPAVSSEEEARRLRRLRRFEEDAAQFKSENVSSPMLVDGNDFNQTVVGTSQKLEKNYLRLTSAPDPATVRPLEVLKKTLELLKDKWRSEQNYTYICDQFKSMRQDLTVQRIKNEFTVQVYEIHARIALEKSDLGEYNQCQTQLKSLYASGIDGHVMEFTAYRVLYFLYSQNWSDVNATMADLTLEEKENEFVQHALKVRSSLATGNYHLFFILYRNAPNMGGYLMDHFCERERVQALIILCKSYRFDIPLDFLQKELAFESQEELLKFLEGQKAKVFKDEEKKKLDAKAALIGLTESVKKFKKIDIKGQL